MNLFKKYCPTCGMTLEKNKKYPEGWGKQFCSENCREEYRKKMNKEESHKSHGCCH